mgnify:FL=1
MNRYYVTIPEGRIKYYAPSEQEVKRIFPEAIEITPLNDTDHLYYIEQIHDQIDKELGKGRWIIDTVFGKMEYQQFYDPDEPHNPLDGCKYRLTEPIGYTFPILWLLSNPEDFYNTYMKIAQPLITNWTRYNYLEWGKIKKDGRFWRTKVKDTYRWFWVNSSGEVYEVDNQPKESKERWKKYKDNPDTIKVETEVHAGKSKFIYFANNAEYDEWAKRNEDEVVLSTKNALPPNPDLAKNVFKLPWFPIHQSPFTDHQTARLWLDTMKQDRELMTFARWEQPYTIETLEALIKEVRNAI